VTTAMTQTYKKKLIEVAIPLEAINAASAREKSIRHGHPSTLHLWWARRPLAACRAVLFAQLVDDPSGYTDTLLEDPKIRAQAEADLAVKMKAWSDRQAGTDSNAANTPEPTLEECAADIERKRLFQIIEDLVKWENSTNEEVLERARAEIRRSCGGKLPPVYDPFSGGGSIPLEAQRLGLPAYGSDLNPVAVMIGKAMVEIPPKFKDMEPIHPGIKEQSFYRNAEGLAEDVKYYGEWMRERAFERIGHLYPNIRLPSEYGGGNATVIAWIWARTVPSPDPAFSDVQVPLASSFILCGKAKKKAWVVPIVDRNTKEISFEVQRGEDQEAFERARAGSKIGRAVFKCLLSGAPISGEYADEQAQKGRMGEILLAVVADGPNGRAYISPNEAAHFSAVEKAVSSVGNLNLTFLETACRGTWGSNAQGRRYKFNTFKDYFTARQLVALQAFSDLTHEVVERVRVDAISSGLQDDGLRLRENGNGSIAYADSISLYLALCIGRLANRCSSLCFWDNQGENVQQVFARQGIAMTWDFVEANPFSTSTGNFLGQVGYLVKAVAALPASSTSFVSQEDARFVEYGTNAVLNTDPPYYDNISYADLSDYFYLWLKPAVKEILPSLAAFISTPKSNELIAAPYRQGGKLEAENYFLNGMRQVMENAAKSIGNECPAAIYYAFRASEGSDEGLFSPGWATFIQAVIDAGFTINGTWPIRSEYTGNLKKKVNALANSVVLVCRKKEEEIGAVTRAEFIRALKRELPPAIAELQAANIAPADMPQSAIGPGMGVFSRYEAVLESDDSPMSVKTALRLINVELDEYLGGIQGEFDPDTRFAISWFEQTGMGKGDYGVADNLARARGIAVESVKHAGIVESQAGKVRILKRSELDPDWEPQTDTHLTVWECLQYLVRSHEKDGISYNTALLLRKIDDKAEAVKDLAYCLYDICANKRQDAKEATAYNALIADWSDLTREAAAIVDVRGTGQTRMDF
jgi:putative DNA methylase